MSHPPQDELLRDLPWPEAPQPPEKLSDKIRSECTDDLKPNRGLSAGRRLTLSVGLAVLVLGVMIGLALRGERPPETLRAALFGAAGWAVVMAAVLAVGLASPPGRRLARGLRLALAVGVPVAFMAYLALAASVRLPLGEFFTAGHAGGAVGCGLHALLFGGIVGGGTLFVWRGTDPFNPGLSGALSGLAAGLIGAVTIGVTCPSGETWHLWLGHGAAVIALALAGVLAGRRWLSP